MSYRQKTDEPPAENAVEKNRKVGETFLRLHSTGETGEWKVKSFGKNRRAAVILRPTAFPIFPWIPPEKPVSCRGKGCEKPLKRNTTPEYHRFSTFKKGDQPPMFLMISSTILRKVLSFFIRSSARRTA